MAVAIVVVASVLVAALIIGFAIWAHQFTKVGPKALTGMKFEDLAKRIPKVSNGHDAVEAEAEELS